MRRSDAGVFLVALVLGGALAWFDSRPNWDDTGVTAGVLLLIAAGFGAARPHMPWRWAFGLGVWIALTGVLIGNPTTLLVLIIAVVGAYVGAMVRHLFGHSTGVRS